MHQKKYTLSKLLTTTLVVLFVNSLFFTGCKKDSGSAPTTKGDARDTVLAINRDVYLWYEVIPSNFNAHNYTDPQGVQAAIRALQPLDRFSFVLTDEEYQQRFVQGQDPGSYGMTFHFENDQTLRVATALTSSSAYANGVRRGWKIAQMNGIAATRTNIDALNNLLNAGAPIKFSFIDPNNVAKDLTIATATLSDDEVMHRSVIQQGGKKIGYLVYNSFLTKLENPGTPNEKVVHPGLNEAFGYFQAQGISDLIIDLRYNGGGYVSVAQQMVNSILSPSANGQVMFKYEFNNKLAGPPYNFNTTINVDKSDPGNPPSLGTINKLVFIVGHGTASASELTINSLKPYFTDLKMVGSTTYGKPVGFQAIETNTTPNFWDFPIMFKTVNKLGNSDYYDGFTPDKAQPDLANKDWGDVSEACLNDALQYIVNGSFPASTKATEAAAKAELGRQLPDTRFKGMIK
ncbi:S41 family peptidase [Solitalea koreensis]|uniref:C-terminal processing protease CtpA/Prc, contains a PDZ domain n=1 Tax=Solitalea koreensis TaxID=543615 RepID=A0A521B205_9SPHI|nr:S41 family peptidase [Solitalea koreensis]SMO41134.1 C-terminal processing protease CtpA/Prc, contains a PDZ domain [Solitalea koreensis]